MASIEPGVETGVIVGPIGALMPEAAPACDSAMVVSLYPDFCRVGSGVIGQDIVAIEADDTTSSPDVFITACPASNAAARLSEVSPAPPGAGVVSNCTGGFARPVAGMSSTVLVDGEECVRHDTLFEMNCAGPEGPGNTLGQMVYDRGDQRFANHSYFDTPLWVSDDEAGVCRRYVPPPPIEIPRESFGEYMYGYGKGLARGTWDAVTGTVEVAAATSQYITDGVLGGPVDLITGGELDYAWLPSANRARRTEASLMEAADAIYNDPGLVWHAMTDEVVTLWQEGHQGEAVGYGATQILDVIAGTHGATKLRVLSRLTPDELAVLVRRGEITAKDAADAAALRRTTTDGVTIHARDIVDAADAPPGQIWEGPTFRGDQRTPAEIRAAGGFQGLDPSGSVTLEKHMDAVRPPSQWVSTSTDMRIAEAYGWRPNAMTIGEALAGKGEGDILGYVYHLNQPGGVNTVGIPGITNTGNLEVAFSQGIPWSAVTGIQQIRVVDGWPTLSRIVLPSEIP